MQSFPLGYRIMDEDLNISFQRKLSFAYGPLSSYNPFYIVYEIGTVDGSNIYTKIGPDNRIPYNIKIGVYRANFVIGDEWAVGKYRIVWKYQLCQLDPMVTVMEDFMITASYSHGDSEGLNVVLP